MRRGIGLAVPALLLVAAACTTSESEPTTTSADPTTTTSSTTTTTAAPPVIDVDRLVIIDEEGLVVTMNRDGSSEVVVSADGEIPFQPIWAPDGQSVAYSDRANSEFIVADAMGGGELRIEMEAPPFYFSWSPSGGELGSLRNKATGGLIHERFFVGEVLTVAEVDDGAPYSFSWNPDGSETVAHVGTERLDLVSSDGNAAALGVTPGVFQAPQWTDGGIVVAVVTEAGQQIVRIDGEAFETLAEVGGSVFFEVSASERYLAVQSFGGEGDSVSVALTDEPVPPNQLLVIDLETGERTVVTDGPSFGFFWSPGGDRLLVMEPEGAPGTFAISIWDNGELLEGPTFQASAQWLGEFIPFYDQYARSMSLWAPDGSAYAFIGTYDGDRGIYVADVASGAVNRVAGGTWVAWSPR